MQPPCTSSSSRGSALSGLNLFIVILALAFMMGHMLFGWRPYAEVHVGDDRIAVLSHWGDPLSKTSVVRPSCGKIPGSSPVLEQWTFAERRGETVKVCLVMFDQNQVVLKDVQKVHAGDRDVTIKGRTFFANAQ